MSGQPIDDVRSERTGFRRAANVLRAVVTVGLLVLGFWLRPPFLGGDTTLVLVQGNSMLPTAHNGDLVIARAKPRYDVGDIAVFRLNLGDSQARPLRVMHRIIAVDDAGSVTTQGDNRTSPDSFATKQSDIQGDARFVVRGVGPLLHLVSRTWFIALVGGALITLKFLAKPDDDESLGGDDEDKTNMTPAAGDDDGCGVSEVAANDETALEAFESPAVDATVVGEAHTVDDEDGAQPEPSRTATTLRRPPCTPRATPATKIAATRPATLRPSTVRPATVHRTTPRR